MATRSNTRRRKGRREADVLAAIASNIRAGITAEGERSLAICAARANARGMSYGQYMAAKQAGRVR